MVMQDRQPFYLIQENNMKRNAGFTLIELIIVIVILGILAVTAAPKFINLQGDARSSTVTAMKGAVEAASSLAHSKAIIAGIDKAPSLTNGITVDNVSVKLVYGYPAATPNGIGNVINAPSSEWGFSYSTSTNTYALKPKNFTPSTGSCVVVYTQATSTAAPTVVATTDGC